MDSRDHVSQLWHFFAAFWLTRGSAGTWPFAAISISSDGFFSFWPRLLHAQQDKTACAADTLLYPKPGPRVVFFTTATSTSLRKSTRGIEVLREDFLSASPRPALRQRFASPWLALDKNLASACPHPHSSSSSPRPPPPSFLQQTSMRTRSQ